MAEVPSTLALASGAVAPDFALPDVEGNLLSPSDVRGPKGLVVAFLCNHCPFVIHLARDLGVFADTSIAKGVGFVGINANDAARYPADSPEKMREMSKKYGWSFPYLYDESQSVARAYFAACTPDFYVFDASLKLTCCGQYDSSRPGNNKPICGEDIRRALQAIIEGVPPVPNQRPSSGCSIKWKPGNEPDYFRV